MRRQISYEELRRQVAREGGPYDLIPMDLEAGMSPGELRSTRNITGMGFTYQETLPVPTTVIREGVPFWQIVAWRRARHELSLVERHTQKVRVRAIKKEIGIRQAQMRAQGNEMTLKRRMKKVREIQGLREDLYSIVGTPEIEAAQHEAKMDGMKLGRIVVGG